MYGAQLENSGVLAPSESGTSEQEVKRSSSTTGPGHENGPPKGSSAPETEDTSKSSLVTYNDDTDDTSNALGPSENGMKG